MEQRRRGRVTHAVCAQCALPSAHSSPQFPHNETDRFVTHMYLKDRAVKCHRELNGRYTPTPLYVLVIVSKAFDLLQELMGLISPLHPTAHMLK